MNPRRPAILAFIVLLALTLTSCGSLRRAGKDLTIVGGFWFVIPYGGATDGYSDALNLREGLKGSSTVEVLAMPFTVSIGLVKHTLQVGIHAVDFVLFPFYGIADMFPNGPVVEPLDYYTGTWFDLESDGQRRSGTDPSSGEDLPPAFNIGR